MERFVQWKTELNGSWLSVGDYNVVSSIDEVSVGGSLAHYRNGRFVDWINEQGLFDLGYSGPKFTWMRDALIMYLPRTQSGYVPLLVCLHGNVSSHGIKRSTFGNIYHKKRRLLARLGGIQWCLANGHSHRLITLEIKLRGELDIKRRFYGFRN
ncbi:hypothetical protein PTKIN_Ptkin04bG0081900 [Pterospermum kingtungense]